MLSIYKITKIFSSKLSAFLYHSKRLFKMVNSYLFSIVFTLRIFFSHIIFKKKVAIGAIFNLKGGVANHILSFIHYSSIPINTVPNVRKKNNFRNGEEIKLFQNLCDKYSLISNNILHSHADTWFINYCAMQQKVNNVKWVHTYHSFYREDSFGTLLNWQKDMNSALFSVAKNADVKITVSKWLQKYLKTKYNISTTYIPNGVDFNKCQRANAQRFTKLYQVTDFILFTSGYSYVKNPTEFVKLARLMESECFVMIGSPNMLNALKEEFGELPRNLKVINDYLSHDLVLDALAASKAFIITSRLEGLPTALMEAMALAKPVVASNIEGCSELLVNGKFGYLYKLGNLEDLKLKTELALKDYSIGLRAQEHINLNYDWKVIAPQIDNIYKDLIK